MPITYVHPMSLPESVWNTLSASLVAEPKIDSTRNTAENIKALYERHLAVVLMEDGIPIGFIAAWPVEEGYVEIGSVWVHPKYRGRGYSHQIYDAIPSLPGIQDIVAFAITTNRISVHVGERVGLKIVEDWDIPVPRHLSCGPCEYVSPADQPACTKRGTSCWLRVITNI